MEVWGFRAGDRVELGGLAKIELNGQQGTVLPLEFPEQAAAMGRVAVMLDSGRRVSVKAESLSTAAGGHVAKLLSGDLGEEWSAELNKRGMSVALALLPAATPQAAAVELTVLNLCLGSTDSTLLGEAELRQRLWELLPTSGRLPDVVVVCEGLEGRDAFRDLGYAKLISSAVKAQELREMVYGDARALADLPPASLDQLVVNELYLSGESAWETVETGLERISGDVTSSEPGGGGPSLAARSCVWARLRSKASPTSPCVFLMGAQLSGGALEARVFPEAGRLHRERSSQVAAALTVFDQRGADGDLGFLVATTHGDDDEVIGVRGRAEEGEGDAGRSSCDAGGFRSPHVAIAARGWSRPSTVPAASLAPPVYLATSVAVPVSTDCVPLHGLWRMSGTDDAGAQLRAALRVALRVPADAGARLPMALPAEGLQELPAVGFGTCFLPEDLTQRVPDQDFRRIADERTQDAVVAALRAGVRLFDSGNKHMNQPAVGRALERGAAEGIASRHEVFVVGRISRCRDEAEVRREVDMLLRELRVEYVDVLMMDIPPERAPAVWPWAEAVYREGRARALGVANFDLLGPKVCLEIFREFLSGVTILPAVHTMEVHPLNTNAEMADFCRSAGIRVLAYSPLGAPHKIEAFMKVMTRSDAQDMRPLLKVPESPVLQEVGKRHGVTPAQVALRWNLQRGHCVVPKSFDPEHIVENTRLFHFSLSPSEMAILAGLHKGVRTERFLQQSHAQGRKALPRMTQDAQDACEAILAKVRGPGSAGAAGTGAERRMQEELMELYRQEEVLKRRGQGVPA